MAVQLIRYAQPFCPQRNLVFDVFSNRCIVDECRLGMVVAIFPNARGDQMQHLISRIHGIEGDHAAVIAVDPPRVGFGSQRIGLKSTILNAFDRRAGGIFED